MGMELLALLLFFGTHSMLLIHHSHGVQTQTAVARAIARQWQWLYKDNTFSKHRAKDYMLTHSDEKACSKKGDNLKQLKSEKRWKRGKHVFWIRNIKNQWIFEETFDVILHGPASTTCTFTYELRSNDPHVRMFDYQKAYPTLSMCVDGGYTPTDISGISGQPACKVWRGFPWRGVVQTDLAFLDSATCGYLEHYGTNGALVWCECWWLATADGNLSKSMAKVATNCFWFEHQNWKYWELSQNIRIYSGFLDSETWSNSPQQDGPPSYVCCFIPPHQVYI